MFIALKSFSGNGISMSKGQEKNLNDINLIQDLLRAGYIAEVKVKNEVKEEVKNVVENEIKEIVEEKEEVKNERKKSIKKNTKKNAKK